MNEYAMIGLSIFVGMVIGVVFTVMFLIEAGKRFLIELVTEIEYKTLSDAIKIYIEKDGDKVRLFEVGTDRFIGQTIDNANEIARVFQERFPGKNMIVINKED